MEAEAVEDEDEDESSRKVKEVQEFDVHEFLKKWDEEFPKIHVPDEILDDIDNDFNLDPLNDDSK